MGILILATIAVATIAVARPIFAAIHAAHDASYRTIHLPRR